MLPTDRKYHAKLYLSEMYEDFSFRKNPAFLLSANTRRNLVHSNIFTISPHIVIYRITAMQPTSIHATVTVPTASDASKTGGVVIVTDCTPEDTQLNNMIAPYKKLLDSLDKK